MPRVWHNPCSAIVPGELVACFEPLVLFVLWLLQFASRRVLTIFFLDTVVKQCELTGRTPSIYSDFQFGTMTVLEDREGHTQMDEKKILKFRQRLLEEYQKLIRSINRNRMAEEEIKLENTEDEGDLATISHNKELLYNLHESDFQRLKSIQEALKRMDRGEYGECVRCGEDINEKRLLAVPWATLCIQCQEEAERESSSPRPVLAGMLKNEDDEEEA